MDLEQLLKPVSEEEPCGPDLEAGGDPDYDMAYFDRMGELPEDFFEPGVEMPGGGMTPDKMFDPKSVNFRDEAKLIDPLLARSRDLRLVVLRAQWAILAGNLAKFVECIEWLAGMLETFDKDVHPQGMADRRSTLGDLNDNTTVVLPLQFLGLTPTGDVSVRKLKVARGELSPLQAEQDLELAPMVDALGSVQNAKPVEKTLEQLVTLRKALTRITEAAEASETAKFTPDFSRLSPTVTEMIEAITSARSDLQVEPEEETAPGGEDEDTGGGGATVGGVGATAATAGTLDVVSHLHAKRLLEACEAYYRAYEPSSATLLLVTQARALIGKPLLEALETLLPDNVEEAAVNFSPATGFALGIARIRALTEDWGDEPDTPLPEPDPGPEVVVADATAAAVAIRSVEEYFRRVERSSPIPALLSRARSYLDRDFQSIIEDLIPKEDEESGSY